MDSKYFDVNITFENNKTNENKEILVGRMLNQYELQECFRIITIIEQSLIEMKSNVKIKSLQIS